MRKEVCTLSQLQAHRLWLLDCEVFARLRDWDAAVCVCSVGRRVLWGAAVASWLLMNSLDALGLPLFKFLQHPSTLAGWYGALSERLSQSSPEIGVQRVLCDLSLGQALAFLW
jgi:hypothetical protein